MKKYPKKTAEEFAGKECAREDIRKPMTHPLSIQPAVLNANTQAASLLFVPSLAPTKAMFVLLGSWRLRTCVLFHSAVLSSIRRVMWIGIYLCVRKYVDLTPSLAHKDMRRTDNRIAKRNHHSSCCTPSPFSGASDTHQPIPRRRLTPFASLCVDVFCWHTCVVVKRRQIRWRRRRLRMGGGRTLVPSI